MPHDDLERLGGDAGVDEPLSTATPEIVGTGVLGSGLPVLSNPSHNDARLLANLADDLADVLGRQAIVDVATMRALPRRSPPQLGDAIIRYHLAKFRRPTGTSNGLSMQPCSHSLFRD